MIFIYFFVELEPGTKWRGREWRGDEDSLLSFLPTGNKALGMEPL